MRNKVKIIQIRHIQTQGSGRGEYCGRRKRNNIQAFAKIAGVVTRGTAAVPVLAGPGIAVV